MGENTALSNHDYPNEDLYLNQWAQNLILAVGKAKARKILAEYQRIARNQKATAGDRATASLRAKILKKYTN